MFFIFYFLMDEMLIHGNVEAANLAFLACNSKGVRMLMLVVVEVLLQTAA